MKMLHANKIKLGIFILSGILLFVFGIYYIGKRQKLFGNTFHIMGIFKDVNGLRVGNNVRFSGINVGIIENMEQISDTSVRVEILLEEKVRKFIKKDAKAIIGSEGLMGNKILIITPGHAGKEMIEDNDLIATETAAGLDEIIENVRRVSENAAVITDNFAFILEGVSEGRGTLGMLLMDTAFADNLYNTMTHIRKGSRGFEKNMEAAEKSFLLKRFLRKKKEEPDKKKKNKPAQ